MKKYRYEFPPLEPHFVESPSSDAIVKYVKRIYPHNFDEVVATLVEIPRWPEFWTVIDREGRALPRSQNESAS